MKPFALILWSALVLLITAPLLLFIEIRLAGREAIAQTLPLVGTSLVLWLSVAAEAFVMNAISHEKAQMQLKVVMLCKTLRFLLTALLFIACAVLFDGDVRLFAVNLIVCYIAITAVNSIGYTCRNKKN